MRTWEAPLSTNAVDTTRWRWPDDMPYPCVSVTSVLSLIVPDGLKKWFVDTDGETVRRISGKAADRGTKVHEIIEAINRRQSPAVDFEFAEIIKQYQEFLSTVQPEFIEIEKELIHKRYGFSGRADCIVRIGDKVELWDYKTGRISTQTGWQLCAYKCACEEMGLKIDGVKAIGVNLKLNKIEVYKYEHFDFCALAFLKALDLFKATYFNTLAKGIAIPNSTEKVKFPIDFLTFDSAHDYAKGIK
jgi:hypothetical protein